MKVLGKIAGLGLLVLGSGTAFAQAGPSMPGPIGPDANASAGGAREQTQSFTHVMNNLDRQRVVTKGAVRKVSAADIAVGAPLRDVNGQPIGKIDSVDADGVVIDAGQSKVKVPLIALGKDNNGLLLGITSAKFNELVTKAHAQTAAAAIPAKPAPRTATKADIVTGAALRDVDGQAVGKITGVYADGATVDTGKTKVKLPLDAFGVDSSGLMIGITAQKLNEIIAQAQAGSAKKQ